MHGNGTFENSDGSRYEGEYDNNLKHGYGLLTYTDGSSCKG